MKNVFLVKTPLQLLNAIEARYYYKLKGESCVLILMADRKSQIQLAGMARMSGEWGSVVDLNCVPVFFENPLTNINKHSFLNKIWRLKLLRRSFFYVWRLNRISEFLGEVNYFFVGYERYIYMKHLVNITAHKKTVLLDDGNATLQLAKERSKGLSDGRSVLLKSRIKLFLKKNIQKINDSNYDRLEFFTIYDISPGVQDSVVRNNFEHLRSDVMFFKKTNEIYFIGSPISESGIISQCEYLNHLKKVRNFYKSSEFIYISHRRESEGNLEKISREIDSRVERFDYPIEYQLSVMETRPLIMASFISSALDSCSLIFGDTMKIIAFKLNLETSPVKDEILSIYEEYESNKNISVIAEY